MMLRHQLQLSSPLLLPLRLQTWSMQVGWPAVHGRRALSTSTLQLKFECQKGHKHDVMSSAAAQQPSSCPSSSENVDHERKLDAVAALPCPALCRQAGLTTGAVTGMTQCHQLQLMWAQQHQPLSDTDHERILGRAAVGGSFALSISALQAVTYAWRTCGQATRKPCPQHTVAIQHVAWECRQQE